MSRCIITLDDDIRRYVADAGVRTTMLRINREVFEYLERNGHSTCVFDVLWNKPVYTSDHIRWSDASAVDEYFSRIEEMVHTQINVDGEHGELNRCESATRKGAWDRAGGRCQLDSARETSPPTPPTRSSSSYDADNGAADTTTTTTTTTPTMTPKGGSTPSSASSASASFSASSPASAASESASSEGSPSNIRKYTDVLDRHMTMTRSIGRCERRSMVAAVTGILALLLSAWIVLEISDPRIASNVSDRLSGDAVATA